MTVINDRIGNVRAPAVFAVAVLLALAGVSASAQVSSPGELNRMHSVLDRFEDCRALAMRGLKQAQDLKCVYLYGRGFGLDMPEAVPEDMLIEGLWLFDHLEAMDLTAISMVSYAGAKEHPHLAAEVNAFASFVPEAAIRCLGYYNKTAKALADAKVRVNQAAAEKTPFEIETLPGNPVAEGPNEGIAGDGFRLGWSWGVAPRDNSDLARYFKQHGYTIDRLYERGAAFGIDYIKPTDGDIFTWQYVEPEEGKFDWTRADGVLAQLKKHGLSLWLRVVVNQSSPPPWLRERLGTAAVLVDNAGNPVRGRPTGGGSFGSVGSPAGSANPPNLFNTDVARAFSRYVEALIQHVKASGVPIVAVEVGSSDIKYGGLSADARKHAWLAKNRHAPATPATEAEKRLAAIDDVRWRQHDYVEYYRPVVLALRKAAPDLPVVMQSGYSARDNAAQSSRNNELLVSKLGVVPHVFSAQSIWDDLGRCLSGTHFATANTHSGGGNAFAQYACSAYVHGSFAVHSWPVPMLRAFFWGDHFLYPDFRPKWSTLFDWRVFQERAQSMAPEMRYTVPAPQTAVLLSATTDMYQSLAISSKGGARGFGNRPGNYHRVGCMGWDRLLNMVNLSHDFVTESQAARGVLSGYELLIMPAVHALPEDAARAIRQFVREGGKVIATSATAAYGADMEKKGGGQLADVFGAELDHFTGKAVIADSALESTITQEALFSHWQGGNVFSEKRVADIDLHADIRRDLYCTFKADDGEVLAKFTDGSPAIILNQFGQGVATAIGYPVGREFFQSDSYHLHFGHNWADWPNGPMFQQGVCLYIEELLKKMGFRPEGVVAEEYCPRPIGEDAGWPAWKWPRKGGGYRDFVWKISALPGTTAPRGRGYAEPRSVEIAFRGREGNPNRYMTIFNREGAYGLDPGVIHFAAISKRLKLEVNRQDIRNVYDVSLRCAVPIEDRRDRTALYTMIEPSMARMFVMSTDGKIRLYEGRRERRGSDADLRKSVEATSGIKALALHSVVLGGQDIVQFLDERGPEGISISCESPMWLPSARRLAQALEARYGKPARITRNSPRIHGAHDSLSAWRDESHKYLERPDIILGNRTESHCVAALCIYAGSRMNRDHQEIHDAPLPIVTTHTFPGPGRCAVALTRPYCKRKLNWDPNAGPESEQEARIYIEEPASWRGLVIGGSDAAGVDAGAVAVIRLLK